MDNSSGGPRQGDSARLPLFRPDVLREQQTQWLGPGLLRPAPMHRWFAATGACTVALVIAVLFAGSYTKKARVAGYLVPAQGMVRVIAPRAGVATSILVREGEQVVQGQVLVSLSSEERSAALG